MLKRKVSTNVKVQVRLLVRWSNDTAHLSRRACGRALQAWSAPSPAGWSLACACAASRLRAWPALHLQVVFEKPWMPQVIRFAHAASATDRFVQLGPDQVRPGFHPPNAGGRTSLPRPCAACMAPFIGRRAGLSQGNAQPPHGGFASGGRGRFGAGRAGHQGSAARTRPERAPPGTTGHHGRRRWPLPCVQVLAPNSKNIFSLGAGTQVQRFFKITFAGHAFEDGAGERAPGSTARTTLCTGPPHAWNLRTRSLAVCEDAQARCVRAPFLHVRRGCAAPQACTRSSSCRWCVRTRTGRQRRRRRRRRTRRRTTRTPRRRRRTPLRTRSPCRAAAPTRLRRRQVRRRRGAPVPAATPLPPRPAAGRAERRPRRRTARGSSTGQRAAAGRPRWARARRW